MDPNANLKEMLELAASIIKSSDEYPSDLIEAVRLAELVESLNDWIRHGGFLPRDWMKKCSCGAVGAHMHKEERCICGERYNTDTGDCPRCDIDPNILDALTKDPNK